MKLLPLLFALLLCGLPLTARELKVLMIGNSFSRPVVHNLPPLAAAGGHQLLITNAYIPGCSLKTHWQNLEKADRDPSFRPYQVTTRRTGDPQTSKPVPDHLPHLLKQESWDLVTIQQASHESWDYAKFQPWADRLIERIRRDVPGAGIMIQQTWSYRADDRRILPGGVWGFDQNGMYDRLAAAYDRLAAAHQLRQIPVGRAVQYFRQQTPVKFTPLPPEQLARLTPPELPPNQQGDVVGNTTWSRPRSESGKPELRSDTIHLNPAGEYLQACVWYAVLFEADPETISYTPPRLAPGLAARLRHCAKLAVTAQPTPDVP